jgi:hypothetical protein
MDNLIMMFSIVFIFYELTKIVFIKKYWIFLNNRKKSAIVIGFEILYVMFLLSMYFNSRLWYFGLGITIISFISASRFNYLINEKTIFSSKVIYTICLDVMPSIIILICILARQLNYF